MRTICLFGGLLLVGAMAACSGGIIPTDGEGGPGPTEPPDGDPPTTGEPHNPFNISSGEGQGPGPTGPGPSSTGSGGCVTCNQVFNGQAMSNDYCPSAEAALTALVTCLSQSCATECAELDTTCQACLQTNCPTEVSDCLAN